MPARRPHVLGVDDGPFRKRQREPVPLVAVMMEAADLVECVSVDRFAVDGPDVTAHLTRWIRSLRAFPSLQAVLLGGITIAGLAVVDIEALARELGLPVLVATRRNPSQSRVCEALRAAGLAERIAIVERAPQAHAFARGLYVAAAGATPDEVRALLHATVRKGAFPEPLRVAHLIGRALVDGESKGRP
jgi:endonuclease V-like protein UPF0215 family